MYGFAVEFIGPDTAKGREMISLWPYEGFRRIFRIITAVWGVGFLLEAALRVAIVYNTSTSTALSLSKVMPYIWVGIFMTWTVAYGRYQGRKGEPMMAAAAAVEGPGTSDPILSQPTSRRPPTRHDTDARSAHLCGPSCAGSRSYIFCQATCARPGGDSASSSSRSPSMR